MNRKFSLQIVIGLFFLMLIASACQPAAVNSKPAPTQAAQPAASVPTQQPTAPLPQATSSAAQAAASPVPSPAKGFVLFDREKHEFQAYALDGSPLFTSLATGVEYPSAYNTFAVNGAVYFIDEKNKQIFRSSPDAVEQVNIPTTNLFTFSVSRDEKRIAWATLDGTNGTSELWIANRDGSDARQIAQYSAKQSPMFVFFPHEWTADGKLLFERTGTGFGGYILFGGMNSLYSYDPATGQFTTYVPAEEQHGLCLDSYRLDLEKVVFNCGQQGAAIIVRNLANQQETILPALPDQGMNGSVNYSPSGRWLAYAIAKGNPDNESGQVVMVPADLSAAPVPIAKVGDNSFAYVQGWLDEDTLLFSRSTGPDGTVWSIKRDGTGLKQLAAGSFIGWIY